MKNYALLRNSVFVKCIVTEKQKTYKLIWIPYTDSRNINRITRNEKEIFMRLKTDVLKWSLSSPYNDWTYGIYIYLYTVILKYIQNEEDSNVLHTLPVDNSTNWNDQKQPDNIAGVMSRAKKKAVYSYIKINKTETLHY